LANNLWGLGFFAFWYLLNEVLWVSTVGSFWLLDDIMVQQGEETLLHHFAVGCMETQIVKVLILGHFGVLAVPSFEFGIECIPALTHRIQVNSDWILTIDCGIFAI
jgi:hypothetical protein